jgi:hypothetical protein
MGTVRKIIFFFSGFHFTDAVACGLWSLLSISLTVMESHFTVKKEKKIFLLGNFEGIGCKVTYD